MTVLPLLAEPTRYRACEADFTNDREAQSYWLRLFRAHFEDLLAAAASSGYTAAQCAAARAALHTRLDAVAREPGRLDILVLDELRREALDEAGIDDAYQAIKSRENDRALAALPAWLAAVPGDETARWERLARGLLAGNLFDMGAEATSSAFAGDAPSPDELLARVPARPWRVDELDALRTWYGERRPLSILLFADNAGADAVLGLLPLARMLLADGANVTVAANRRPSLNDVTADEMRDLVTRAATIDDAFGSPRLHVVDSGCEAPLIDLADVSTALVERAVGTDLVILIGMGRSIESNWRCPFTCAAWRVAMIKDPQVAGDIEATLFDAVCRFDPPGADRFGVRAGGGGTC